MLLLGLNTENNRNLISKLFCCHPTPVELLVGKTRRKFVLLILILETATKVYLQGGQGGR